MRAGVVGLVGCVSLAVIGVFSGASSQVATAQLVVAAADDTVWADVRFAPHGPNWNLPTEAVLTGQEVKFDALASRTQGAIDGGCPWLGSYSSPSRDVCTTYVTKFEWDLDGNGTFETVGGATASVPSFPTPGARTVSVRLTSRGGGTGVATVSFDVRPAPPTEDTGASINGGAQFTNNPDVTVSLSWPALANLARLSNDGGFANAQSRNLATTVPWKLESSGPERLPKTIYVRFRGAGDDTKTFQDDIILDETAPVIAGASVASSAGAQAAAKSRTYRIKVRASDATSGVATAQFATDKLKKKLSKAQKYSATLTFKATAKPLWVRVQDRAGNFSKWKKLP